MQFDNKTINKLLKIDDSFKAPSALLEIILDDKQRPKLFKKFLQISTDLNSDWFHNYFEEEQSEHKTQKQDFTPDSISELINSLVANDNDSIKNKQNHTYYEPAAGTGGVLIKKWLHDRNGHSFFTYDPRAYWYQAEEISDRAIPFLLFNMAIRGMNGAVIQCNSLTRQTKEVYFIRNDSNDPLAFSEVIKMPHSKEIAEMYNVRE